jgi:hypothetical protein
MDMTGLVLLVCALLLLDHRAFCAALIFLRADAERVRRDLVAERPPFNLPRTERVSSICRSRFTSFVLSALNWETKDAKLLKFAIDFPSGKDVSRIV